jgi:hypothetical protein
MKKCSRSVILIFGVVLVVVACAAVTPSNAFQQVVIPYGYVGDSWDSVIVISNLSTKAINPAIVIRNLNPGGGFACYPLLELGIGEIYVSTLGAITGWCQTPPIPGIFQVFVGAFELEAEDTPFGVAIAINNASFGGFGFQQFKSASEPVSGVYLACTCQPSG